MRPTISIVLASSQPRSALDAYVSTLTARCAGSRTELIIARADTALHIGLLSRIHPQARFVSAPGECSMGELRTYGMRAATGDIVLLLDDSTVIDERFLDSVLGQFTRPPETPAEQHDRSPSSARASQRREPLRASGES
jgi:hypothetical protein